MRITTQSLERIDACLAGRAPNLQPILRWLVLGRELSETLFTDATREPTVDEVYALMQCINVNDPRIMAPLRSLIMQTEFCEPAMAELQLDDLLVASDWNHPVTILGRSRATTGALLTACRRRLGRAEGEYVETLEDIEGKLKRTLEVERLAEGRREQHGKRRERGGRRPRAVVERQGVVSSGHRAP